MTEENPKTEMVEGAAQDVATVVDDNQPEKFDEARAMELIRKQREELKQAKKAAAELERYRKMEEERKQAEMSETERLQAELDRAHSELKAKTVRTMQIEVAAKVGIPAALSDRLKGETPEEMEEDAKAILEALPKQKAAPNTGATNPGEKAGSGDDFESAHKRWKAGEKQPNPFLGGGVVFPPTGGNF